MRASGSGSKPFECFPSSHLRNATRIISSQIRLKSNCSAVAEIRFMNSPIRMSDACISLALRWVEVRRRRRCRPLVTSRPTTPMYIGRDVAGSRCLSPSASRQNTFHQLATMAMSLAIVRHGLRSFVTNPPQPYWFLYSSKLFSQFQIGNEVR